MLTGKLTKAEVIKSIFAYLAFIKVLILLSNYFKMNSINANIDLSFQQLVDAIKKLTPKEKLLLNDVLWNESMEIPAEHQPLVLGQ